MNESKIKQVFKNHSADKEEIRKNILSRINAAATASNQPQHTFRPRRSFRLKPALALGLVLFVLVGSFSGYAIAAEMKEYSDAVEFFSEYNLPTDGLNRTEIKAVYKDITQKTYSYGKTIELFNNISVELYSTALNTVDKDSLDALWNARNSLSFPDGSAEINLSGIHYNIEYVSMNTTSPDAIPLEQAVIIKSDGENELWRYAVPHDMYVFIGDNVAFCDDGLIVYGSRRISGSSSVYAIAFMLNNSGELLWEYSYDVASSDFEIIAVSDNEIALFGTKYKNLLNSDGDLHIKEYYSTFTLIDMDGNLLKYNETASENYTRFDTAVKIDDYYLVKRYVRGDDYTMLPELVSVAADGSLIDKFTYSDGDNEYIIRDIIYHEGKIYLSALLPNIAEAVFTDKMNELMDKYYDAWNNNFSDSGDDSEPILPDGYHSQLRELFAGAYSAALLVCDSDATIAKAYSVENARAGTLAIDKAGALTWQVLRIDDVKNASPYISSHRADILATEFSFVFDADGRFIEKSEIGPCRIWY